MADKIVYYKDGDTVKAKFVNSDTTSDVFKAMERIVCNGKDTELEENFKNYQKTLPPTVNPEKEAYKLLATNAEKIEYIAKKLGLKD